MAGVALLIYGLVGGCNEVRYHSGGKVATARVTGSWTMSNTGGGGTRSDYEFSVDGKTYDGAVADYNGQELPVEYLSSDPDVHRPASESWFPMGPIALVAGIGLIAFGVYPFNRNDELMDD